MSDKPIFRLDVNDPDVQSKMDGLHQQMLAGSPKRVRQLGKILRARSVTRMRLFLLRYGLGGKIKKHELPLFMDWLITKRIDLKDMEPEARKRLRVHTLENQPEGEKTEDYTVFIESSGKPLTCKHCSWFVVAPPDEEKSCVEMGTKGIDTPCYGFTLSNRV